MTERLYRVEGPDLCAGLLVSATGMVCETAPLLAWALGWNWMDADAECSRRGWLMKENP